MKDNQNVKKDSEILAEIYRNAQLALTSIADILPEIEDGAIKSEIIREHGEYERIAGRRRASQRSTGWSSNPPAP